ncbi:DUF4365 domain-containing protein [Acidiferrimicrobium sp. IK]|uniref:DUF4365 domain-containing protein n=1 Tax=Acidiferrimicrobium sp. IK TaxID=2871700 RepID=UPI0021CAEDE2|nr:DUF4365 domain-containing protein [Acidiferrimicrobium sp. IK]MCU4187212.1 DUF4365 domain-containing protein [Acidiferrimicrobium sp. IK]
MEQLQEGYVQGVAATAGCTVEPIRRDVFGLDVEIIQAHDPDAEELTIRAQLKNTTTVKPDPTAVHFSYQLKKRDYFVQLAKHRTGIKAILLVMVTSPDQSLWTAADHGALTMAHCCYWVNLENQPVPAAQSPTVHVPLQNIFDAASLTAMFDRMRAGVAI